MMEIASAEPNKGVFQKDIAKNQDISIKYLDHIIHALRVAGLISNVKGKKSGYILTRDCKKITVLDIHNAFEPGICVIDCLSKNVNCDRENNCAAKGFWGELNNIVLEHFKKVTLCDLVTEQVKLEA